MNMTEEQKNLRRIAVFALLSLVLHFLLGGFFYRLQERLKAKAPPPPPEQEVVWVDPGSVPPPSVPVVSANNLQLADIAKPKLEKVPERTRFASKYNSSVPDETVAAKIPKNARLDSETDDDGKRGDNADVPAPKPEKKVAMKEPEPEPEPPAKELEKPEKKPEEQPEKSVSLEDLALKPSDFKDLMPKESKDPKKVAMKEPSPSKKEKFELPRVGRPGAPGEPDSFASDFFPDVKVGGKTYLNTAAFPDVQYFTQLKRIFRMRFNPATPLRAHFAGNRVVVGKVNVSMAVTVSADGRLKDLFVIKSSGIPGYDEEALRTIRQSAPFAKPPAKVMEGGELRMNWNFITYL